MKDWKTTTIGVITIIATLIVCFPNQFGGAKSDLVIGAKNLLGIGSGLYGLGFILAGDAKNNDRNQNL